MPQAFEYTLSVRRLCWVRPCTKLARMVYPISRGVSKWMHKVAIMHGWQMRIGKRNWARLIPGWILD